LDYSLEEIEDDPLGMTSNGIMSREEEIDQDALRLETNDCEIFIDNPELKDLEL
jgi:hypothetical protein